MIGDHGDELAIGGLALDAADGVAEELLQHLHVAPTSPKPRCLAVFRDLRPERRDPLPRRKRYLR